MAARTRRGWLLVLAIVATAGIGLVVAIPLRAGAGPVIVGVEEGATVNRDGLGALAVTVPDGAALADVQVSVDGDHARVRRDGDRLRLADPDLAEGTHTVTARLAESLPLMPDHEASRRVTVDTTPPTLTADIAAIDNPRGPLTVRGSAEGATSVTVAEKDVPLDDRGHFAVTLPDPSVSVALTARDAAGNTSTQEVPVPVRHPGMRAVHMSALAWTSAALREPVLRMAREKRIDTIQLDLKDESGEIGYRSQVPLAQQIGATRDHYDAKAVVDQLHAEGIRVVGRLVAFRDPILARASWDAGAKNRVVQTAAGEPWTGSYGDFAFTNFADPEVIAYNVTLAREAAELGFDDVLYDYVRRPEGAITQMRMPGLTTTPEQAIAGFLAESRAAVREHGAFLGASVFGIAVQDPTSVAQDIPAIAEHVDYVAPMVYPSHWGPGEYGVAQPNAQPYDITARSLAAFAEQVGETGAQVIPWLQAFSLGHTYGPAEVLAQITAAKDNDMPSFLLWNAACRYESFDLPPIS